MAVTAAKPPVASCSRTRRVDDVSHATHRPSPVGRRLKAPLLVEVLPTVEKKNRPRRRRLHASFGHGGSDDDEGEVEEEGLDTSGVGCLP